MTGSRTGKVEITQLPETLNNIMIVQLTILHHHISCLWHLSHYCNNWCGHRPLSTSPEFLLTFPPDSFAAFSLCLHHRSPHPPDIDRDILVAFRDKRPTYIPKYQELMKEYDSSDEQEKQEAGQIDYSKYQEFMKEAGRIL